MLITAVPCSSWGFMLRGKQWSQKLLFQCVPERLSYVQLLKRIQEKKNPKGTSLHRLVLRQRWHKMSEGKPPLSSSNFIFYWSFQWCQVLGLSMRNVSAFLAVTIWSCRAPVYKVLVQLRIAELLKVPADSSFPVEWEIHMRQERNWALLLPGRMLLSKDSVYNIDRMCTKAQFQNTSMDVDIYRLHILMQS